MPERFRITSQIAGKIIPSRQSRLPFRPSSRTLRGRRQI
jgi:hypothetical protein